MKPVRSRVVSTLPPAISCPTNPGAYFQSTPVPKAYSFPHPHTTAHKTSREVQSPHRKKKSSLTSSSCYTRSTDTLYVSLVINITTFFFCFVVHCLLLGKSTTKLPTQAFTPSFWLPQEYGGFSPKQVNLRIKMQYTFYFGGEKSPKIVLCSTCTGLENWAIKPFFWSRLRVLFKSHWESIHAHFYNCIFKKHSKAHLCLDHSFFSFKT